MPIHNDIDGPPKGLPIESGVGVPYLAMWPPHTTFYVVTYGITYGDLCSLCSYVEIGDFMWTLVILCGYVDHLVILEDC